MDGGIFLGNDPTRDLSLATGEMLRRLEACGVERALAASFRAIHFSADEGNRDAVEAARASGGRLVPMAVANLMGFDPGAGQFRRWREEGARMLALFPQWQGWSFGDYGTRAMGRTAAEAGLPIQCGLTSRAEFGQVADRLGDAGTPVLLRWMRGSGYTVLNEMLALARDFPHFLFDAGAITQTGGIALLAERVGAERLFLASNLPYAYEGSPYFLLEAADLPEEAKRLVRGGTLERLLGLDPMPTKAPARYAELVSRPKIDTHYHTSGWNIIEPRIASEHLVDVLGQFGYRHFITSSIRALNDDIEAGNAETAALIAADSRVRGLIVINPLQPERSIRQVEEHAGNPGFVGLKSIQDFYNLKLDAPGYRTVFEHARRHHPDFPVMAHLGGMREAALAFPELGFVAAHATWNHRHLMDLPNVWYDIATSTPLTGQTDLADLIQAVGVKRVIFSCDGQLMCPAFTLGKLAGLDLSEDALEAIFLTNAADAFPRLRLPS